ncbi:FRG domain-containing protein [Paenibacillus tarimensis]|uniref:FRG domain-containing protein n=1 Tax=Paenibacillus tarimensis TaxID=416012 RepID=UPI001F2A1FA3|nr:FRG domain-containing protein [Paenibacillus tarimensis]MCF2946324.1 FRG domain-containing protein [Paenibacillus tarimensis]
MNEFIEIRTVTSIAEYLTHISEYNNNRRQIWYRGQASSDDTYKLLPGIYREPYSLECELDFYHSFKARAIPFIDFSPSSNWDWQFLMQHYGLPTRFLDWTEDALIAIAFAVLFRKEHHQNHDAVVWCLDPYELNSAFNLNGVSIIPNVEMEYISSNFDIESRPLTNTPHPIAVIGSLNNNRIIAQKGVFTLFPKSSNPSAMEQIANSHNFLLKIIIKEENITSISTDLRNIGISESTLYPSLESVANQIKRQFVTQGARR